MSNEMNQAERDQSITDYLTETAGLIKGDLNYEGEWEYIGTVKAWNLYKELRAKYENGEIDLSNF